MSENWNLDSEFFDSFGGSDNEGMDGNGLNPLQDLPVDGMGSVSFGANQMELEAASILHKMGDELPSPLQQLCDSLGDCLSGVNQPGMEIIRNGVQDTAEFFKVEEPHVFYEQGELGVQWGGLHESNFDNWIGGDPQKLQGYASRYGGDFVSCVMGHEAGHHLIDRIGWDDVLSCRGNEAASDYLTGIYAGSRNLAPEGLAQFLREEGNIDQSPDYPLGEERESLFMRGYNEAQHYPFKNFQSVMDDMEFNLHGKLRDIQEQFG